MEKVFIFCLLCVYSISLVQGAPSPIFQELITNIHELEKLVKMDAEELHTPKNIQEHCLHSAFKCFVNESLTLKPADNRKEDVFNGILSRIKYSQPSIKLTASGQMCSPCTNYEKKPKRNFLKDFIVLLQMLNMRAMTHGDSRRSTI